MSKRNKHMQPVFEKIWFEKGIKFRYTVARNRVNLTLQKGKRARKFKDTVNFDILLNKRQVKICINQQVICDRYRRLTDLVRYETLRSEYLEKDYSCLFDY